MAGGLLGGIVAMITLEHLVAGYRGRAVTQPISGQFETGSLTAIMGPNGAGKSTVVKTLCGLQSPVSGQVNCSAGLTIAWLPQRAEVDCDFPISVYDVVAMGCWPVRGILGLLRGKDHVRIQQALAQVGISELAERSIGELSGGQFQRMLFARLLVQDAEVMVMDEPFAGIDQITQQVLMQLIIALNKQGKTLITVLHDFTMVRRCFPQLLLITPQQITWGATQNVLADQAGSAAREKLMTREHQEKWLEYAHH